MSLDLDSRQRAMLREMGVQVWLPEKLAAPVVEPSIAIENIAAGADDTALSGLIRQNIQIPAPVAPSRPVVAPAVAAPRAPTPPPAWPDEAGEPLSQPSWRLGEAQALYASTGVAGGARWLVLAQMPVEALAGDVFVGDAGRLLDNMLRAARLPAAGAVFCAPVVRYAAAPPDAAFSAALAAMIGQCQPDVLLLMGRMASQALLQSTEPLGRLRGQVHALHGVQAVVTYDAPYLLRTWADKAKAWDDLCLAMSLVTPA